MIGFGDEKQFTSEKVVFEQRRRIRLFGIALGLVFFALLGRLWYLQILNGLEYQRIATLQSSRQRPILPLRGKIMDRNGIVLVDNQPSLRLRFFPERVSQIDKTIAFLQQTLTFVPPNLEERLRSLIRQRPYRDETLVENLNRDELARIASRQYLYPEIEVQTVPARLYTTGNYAAHIFGYLGEISDQQLNEDYFSQNYAAGDVVGKLGIEKMYEPWLFGTKGLQRFRVDANGRVVELIEQKDPSPGWDLYLTLDWPTQATAETALGDAAGAIVALDPNTGAILAIVSHPGFSPEAFIGGIRHSVWDALNNDPKHPLEHRPVRGLYAPASTIKSIVALAALDAGVVTPTEKVNCTGSYQIGNRRIRCWKEGGHGLVNLHQALVESCDTFFYEISRRLGITKMADFNRLMGLGKLTGIDLQGEKQGLVPDPVWKKRTGRGPWHEGETVITAIGQGSLLVTPLQLARSYSAIANGGFLITPHLKQTFANHQRPSLLPEPPLPVSTPINLNPKYIQLIQAALVDAVQAPNATGARARIAGVDVAGKTGTAQVIQQKTRGSKLEEHLRDHAWFVGYAPSKNPKIVVAVIVENGGSGGHAAAPIAGAIMKTYLENIAKQAGRS